MVVPRAWIAQPIHFVDFEGSISSGIVEYGVATLQDGGVTNVATRLCRPTGRVRADDIAVHGLRPEKLAGHAPIADDFETFIQWRDSGPFAAHFAGAENSMLKSVWPYPRAVVDFVASEKMATDWGPWVDTGALYRQLYPAMESYKLADLVAACALQAKLDELAAQHCPPDRAHYHAAPYDALAGALLLLFLGTEPSLAALSLGQLLALSTLDAGRRDAIRQPELF